MRGRSLAFVLMVGLAVGAYLLAPDYFKTQFRRLWAKFAGGSGRPAAGKVQPAKHTRFVELEGTVQVKQRNAANWGDANLRMVLTEGDMVQTKEEGLARIEFLDGTLYVVKPETLIVIERNTMLSNQATRVAVQVSSGTVDLSTPTWKTPESSSEVRFENAVARMGQNSRAAIRQDPNANVYEISMVQGNSTVSRGGDVVEVGANERAYFRGRGDTLRKERVGARPQPPPAPVAEKPAAAPPPAKPVSVQPEVIAFQLFQRGRIKGTVLEPGDYVLDLKSNGQATIYRENKLVLTMPVRIRPLTSGITRVSVMVDPDGTIREVRTRDRVISFVP